MKILGIETSCDETAVAVVENGVTVLSSIISTQIKEHRKYGGVVPEIASRRHCEKIVEVYKLAIEKAKIAPRDIDAVAVTFAPGLIGSLLVGVNFAKGLCFALNKPIIAVHHLKAHIAANYLSFENLKPPFIALVISGGHTNIVLVQDFLNFKIIGKTMDDAVGEAFDKIGRSLGLSYPAGAEIDKLSKLGDKNKYSFTKPKILNKKFCFSFSGMKTAVINTINNEKNKNENLSKDIAASFQAVVCNILVEKTIEAAKFYNVHKIAVCGGVSANSGVREIFKHYCKINNIDLFIPELKFCTDNAAMVASQGYFQFKYNHESSAMNLNAKAFLPIDS